MKKFDEFTEAYIKCALWSTCDESTPEGGEPFDVNYDASDLSPECLAVMVEDCERFKEKNALDIVEWDHHTSYTATAWGQAGHDFWLTRNRHGAGFWDGDWPEEVGERLTEASDAFGEVDLYVSDTGEVDGLIYCCSR